MIRKISNYFGRHPFVSGTVFLAIYFGSMLTPSH